MITQLDPKLPITKDGMMEDRFFNWHLNVSSLSTLTGVGSPEGVVAARPTRLYMDTAGTAGAILYIKRDADIAGDRTQGWILV
jgi:hypothetical protein